VTVSTSSPSKAFTIDDAGPLDGPRLLEILESSPMPGPISVVYTRRPDAYASFQREGETVRIVVARAPGGIFAMGAFAVRTLYVAGTPTKVAYLFGLRSVDHALKRRPLLHRGYARIGRQLQELGVCHAITTIVASNHRVAEMLARRRAFMPAYEPLGRYDVFALLPRRRRTTRVRRAVPADASRIAQHLNEIGRTQDYFPVVTEGDLLEGRGIPKVDAFHWIEGRPGEVLAAAALWDQTDYRQYRVAGYAGSGAWLRRFAPLFGMPNLPAPGQDFRYATLALWAARDPALLGELLDGLPGGHSFVLAGAHVSHPFHDTFRRRRHVRYESDVFRVTWDESALKPSGPIYLECGTL